MTVITNNPHLRGAANVQFVDGSFRDVLIKVRDLVYVGHELVSHPLFASLGMMFSPYRTVILSERKDTPSAEHARVVEDSIISYDHATQERQHVGRNDEDYARMDLELYRSACEECGTALRGREVCEGLGR
ncbi:hypothetical protein J2S71_002196 [Olsenella profusa DSM 13989]|uniref:GrdX protein n=1 Tax=Olsenella profusa F0195 TaxID=1125712 RepID=U2TQI1_9ACTN|nr:GrdX family protein [Olsenella profusa]ERL08368.1 hypothetical protein HMPREF1316_0147 [Olsenella profusa F0195]MDP9860500.1 hypothetical protein [Olsenella profusa DSM 13989]